MDTYQSFVTAPVASTRVNLEENSMMKREMQYQMAFQNKMRALKRQEVEKYKVAARPPSPAPAEAEMAPEVMDFSAAAAAQGAGESIDGPPETRRHGNSLGHVDDLWNTDVMDDQLFEFLMNN